MDSQPVIDTATRAAQPVLLEDGSRLAFHVPTGGRIEVIDSGTFDAHPRRPTGTFSFIDPASYIAYLHNHTVAEDGFAADEATIWADPATQTLTAVLNGHAARQGGWGDWRANFNAQATPEWKAWRAKNGVMHDQVAFAEFLEDRLGEIAEPPGAVLLELATTFQASASADFRSAAVLQSGARKLVWQETIDAKGGPTGEIAIPATFTLYLALFEGTAPRQMTARLRFRINGGKLTLGYQLADLDRHVREAFDEIVEQVRATNLDVYYGTPAEAE